MLQLRTSALGMLALFLALAVSGGWSCVEAGYRPVANASPISGLCSDAAEHLPGIPIHHCRAVDSAALISKLRQRSRHVLPPSFERQVVVPAASPVGKMAALPRSRDRLLRSCHHGAPFFEMLARTTRNLN